jgi:spore maturation protein CgeB
MRTFEVPACGGFMLAERTQEHLEIFKEDEEIVCFSTVEELVDKVRYYSNNDRARQTIAKAGYERVLNDHHTYRDRLIEIFSLVGIKS